MNMKTIAILICLVVLLVLALPTIAQDDAPAPVENNLSNFGDLWSMFQGAYAVFIGILGTVLYGLLKVIFPDTRISEAMIRNVVMLVAIIIVTGSIAAGFFDTIIDASENVTQVGLLVYNLLLALGIIAANSTQLAQTDKWFRAQVK